MKTLIIAIASAGFIFSCGPSDKTSEMSPEQEAVMADTLSSELETDTQELKKSTESNLQEVDSLLQNF